MTQYVIQVILSAYSVNRTDFIMCLKDETLTSMIGYHVLHKVGYTYNVTLSTNFDFIAAIYNKSAFLVVCWSLVSLAYDSDIELTNPHHILLMLSVRLYVSTI